MLISQAPPPPGDLNLPGCDPGSNTLDLTNCLRLSGTQTVGDVYSTPAVLIDLIVRNLFPIAGVILFVMIIFAGFQYITNPKGPDEARSILEAAIIGLIIMFAAYWILQIVKIITGANVGI